MKKILLALVLSVTMVAGFGNLAKGQCCPPGGCPVWCVENDLCDTLIMSVRYDCGCGDDPVVLLPNGGRWCSSCYTGDGCPGACPTGGALPMLGSAVMSSSGGGVIPCLASPCCVQCVGFPSYHECGIEAVWSPLTSTWVIGWTYTTTP